MCKLCVCHLHLQASNILHTRLIFWPILYIYSIYSRMYVQLWRYIENAVVWIYWVFIKIYIVICYGLAVQCRLFLLAQIVDVLHLTEVALSRDDPRLKQKCFMKPRLREPLFAHKKECKFFYSNNRVRPIIKEWRAANQKTKFDVCVSTASGRSAFKVQKCSKSQDSWWKSKYLRLI